jgi:hypothetical protein
MAIINGPIEFKGSFGNMRCYYDPGTKQSVFGLKGGFNKKQYQTLALSFLADKKTATLTIPGFVTNNDSWWVTKYYAFRLYLVIAQISDMAYNTENKKWEQ